MISQHEEWPNSSNLEFVEALYEQYHRDPASVSPGWQSYFRTLAQHHGNGSRVALGPSFEPRSIFNPPSAQPSGSVPAASATLPGQPSADCILQHKVDQLIRNYRVRGHIVSRIDPLGQPRPEPPELTTAFYGLTDHDLDRVLAMDNVAGKSFGTVRQIIELMRNTYCRSIGVQFMHIDDYSVRAWLQQRMEGSQNRIELSRREQLRILTRLTDAVIFEQFIQKKFVGAKSFSLEGAESLVPLLDLAIEKAGDQGVSEIIIGMAHRGRLNVLCNVMGKRPRDIFREFKDHDGQLYMGSGDVKYHLGYSSDWITRTGRPVHLSLCFNPSHLEFVNPVALGRARAKQDRMNAPDAKDHGVVFLIHGDAAFIGEGVVQETLNLSGLEGYSTGGTLHIIVNNQIGFTTNPSDARSTTYASDIAKMLQVPIFHVNGEDPEAVAQCVRLAMDFRKQFKRDVVIDMYCYRRRGHNEGDEPAFTQPMLYAAIEKRKPVREGYLDHLLTMGGVTRDEADQIATQRTELLEKDLALADTQDAAPKPPTALGVWTGYITGPEPIDQTLTGVPKKRLSELLEKLAHVPEGFNVHPKAQKIIGERLEMARGEKPLNWAAAELLAYASIATEGFRVRISGQDVLRGTFTHRHAAFFDTTNGKPYLPLRHLSDTQAQVDLYNSPLSETGVLGFEYGYSLDTPDGLVIWEAQFGDFWNVAQVIVDQFIASAEAKWKRHSGLTMFLPHGFEGQGPEHSSGRIERFLLLAAKDNIQVANPTTPAQMFHLLRRQAVRKWRKPLVVMTPKSLLRHPLVISSLDELERGRFQRILPEPRKHEGKAIKRIVLCSGKLYYELEAERAKLKLDDIAILRVEQLYPLTDEMMRDALSAYAPTTPVIWAQEEPDNMGAWRFMRALFGDKLLGTHPFVGVSRPAAATPATGSLSAHKVEQAQVIKEALGAK